MPTIATSFPSGLRDEIQQWVNTPVPSNPEALRAYCDCALSMFSQVTTQHDPIVSHQTFLISEHEAYMHQAQDLLLSLQHEFGKANEMMVED